MAIPAQAPTNRDSMDVLGTSKPVGSALGGSAAIRVERLSYPFLLRHYVGNWTPETEGLDGETVLLPEIVPHIIRAGAGLVRTVNKGEGAGEAYRAAVREAKDLDWHYLDHEMVIADPAHLPKGVAPGAYIRGLPAVYAKSNTSITWYYTPWEVPVQTPKDQRQRWRFDHASYNRWRLSLVVEGLIPEPMDSVLDELRTRYGKRVSRVKGTNNPDREHKQSLIAAAEAVASVVSGARIPRKGETPKPAAPAKKGA